MKENEKKGVEAQGVETQEVKKKQAISKSYLVKSFGENIKKLVETELITNEQAAILVEIQKEAVNKWVGQMSL